MRKWCRGRAIPHLCPPASLAVVFRHENNKMFSNTTIDKYDYLLTCHEKIWNDCWKCSTEEKQRRESGAANVPRRRPNSILPTSTSHFYHKQSWLKICGTLNSCSTCFCGANNYMQLLISCCTVINESGPTTTYGATQPHEHKQRFRWLWLHDNILLNFKSVVQSRTILKTQF